MAPASRLPLELVGRIFEQVALLKETEGKRHRSYPAQEGVELTRVCQGWVGAAQEGFLLQVHLQSVKQFDMLCRWAIAHPSLASNIRWLSVKLEMEWYAFDADIGDLHIMSDLPSEADFNFSGTPPAINIFPNASVLVFK